MIVDTHAHIYSEDYEKYPLMDDPKEILIFKDHRKHFLPQKGRGTIEDLKLEVKQNDVDKVVIVIGATEIDFQFSVSCRRGNGGRTDEKKELPTLWEPKVSNRK